MAITHYLLVGCHSKGLQAWAKRGKKKVVWRCISRLDYGTKYCKHSPTIEEERLHAAVLRAINAMMSDREKLIGIIKTNLAVTLSENRGEAINPPAHRKQAGRAGSHSEQADCDHHKGKYNPSIRSPIQGDFG